MRRIVGFSVLALPMVLLFAACGDDGDSQVEASSSSTSTVESTTTTTTAVTTTTVDDAAQPGLAEFAAGCRDGDAADCRQLSDVTLQEICQEGQTVACQTYGARTGEGDPDGDGTVPFEEGCRAGEFDACAQLSDATLQAICDEGQEAACQTYLARTGDG